MFFPTASPPVITTAPCVTLPTCVSLLKVNVPVTDKSPTTLRFLLNWESAVDALPPAISNLPAMNVSPFVSSKVKVGVIPLL